MLDQETTTATVDTDISTETNSQASKTFTQDEVNAILAKTKGQLEKKLSSKYADLGEPDELRDIVTNYRKQQQELEVKRGNFDKIIADLAAKKDAEISKRDSIIRDFKLEQPLLNLAAQYRSVNPAQVKQLLRNNLRLNDDGEVEVVDDKGAVRYSDAGKPLSVEQYVQDWLQANPHFVSAAPATTTTQGGVRDMSPGPVDLTSLDMTRADHRKIFAQARAQGKI
jgi:hypothetical protein